MNDENHEDAPGEEPVRICPGCSTQSSTAGEYCPHCGASFVRRRHRRSRRFKIILASLVALFLLGGGGTAAALKVNHDNGVTAERDRAAADAARTAKDREDRKDKAERERQREEDAQNALDDIELAGRRHLERSLQRAITKDAEEKVSTGLLDGPILKTFCDPVGGGRDDLSSRTGKYECLAATEEQGDGLYSGYSFDATINYKDYSYSWRLGN